MNSPINAMILIIKAQVIGNLLLIQEHIKIKS